MQLTNIIRTISLIGACVFVTLSPTARAVSPPPDGGYPGFNTAEGDSALLDLTTGTSDTAIGYQALLNNTTGTSNTSVGDSALTSNTIGDNNTATGAATLVHNTTGSSNTADGWGSLSNNTTGNANTATGNGALFNNTTGYNNTADGLSALNSNSTGFENTATGNNALGNNTTGTNNVADGSWALSTNTTGGSNTANGAYALGNNTTGGPNTANGESALFNNTTGSSNTGIGNAVLFTNTTGNNNTAAGFGALFNNTGSNNIALGFNAGTNLTTGSDNVDIGNSGVAGEAGIIRIGTSGSQTKTFVAGVRGVAIAGGAPVAVSASGQLGMRSSSARFKEAIKPMDKASEAIFSLQPVTFRYKKALDPEALPQFGLVAEQVAKVDPDLVMRDADGKPYTVRYEEVNAMLLNEFLKEHRKVEEQGRTIGRQETEIRALASQLQKVSNEIELIKPASRVVTNQ